MKRKKQLQLAYTICTFLLLGTLISCGESTESGGNENPDSTKTIEPDGSGEITENEIGAIPFDFPVVSSTSAKAEETVLAPSRAFIDAAFEKDGSGSFIFYAATVESSGTDASDLETLAGTKSSIPNSLIIPLGSGETAKKGDVVLSWWQSGSGMNRCYVVDDSDPTQPGVTYIDIAFDNPAKGKDGVGIGQMTEKLKPNSFKKITALWQPGSAVAAKDGSSWKHGKIISVSGGKVLTIGFAGSMKVYNKADCTPIPAIPTVKKGDDVHVPQYGSMKKGTVTKIDKKFGRVDVLLSEGSKSEIKVAFGDVVSALD